jgi:hypothetical protein
VTIPGFKCMQDKGFYSQPPSKGREIALESLTASEVTPVSRGIRLGGMIPIRTAIAAPHWYGPSRSPPSPSCSSASPGGCWCSG